MKFLSFVFVSLLSVSAFAQDGDLVLQGAKWIAKFKSYNCVAFGPEVAAPTSHADLSVAFEQIVTDSTLDNGLLTANFQANGKSCRYSAILLADNDASTIKLVESRARALEADADCAAGKAALDANLASNDYLYWGHPHNLTVMIPATGAEVSCPGSSLVGVNFVVAGRIQK